VRDFDEDGLISKYEFFYIHYLYCRDVTEKSVNELFDEYSLTYEDKLTLEEFTLIFCEECKMDEVPQCEENAMDDFEAYDDEQDNLLSESEFAQLYSVYFSEGNEYHRDYLFTVYDTDFDNMLSLNEFKEFYCNQIDGGAVIGECPEWSINLFNAFDIDQSGSIDADEYQVLNTAYGPFYKHMYQLFGIYDMDEDGELSPEEYEQLLCTELAFTL
jgi:Ca2+-binding EF-hand superfamily protein